MMAQNHLISGGCQCGAVRFEVTAMIDNSHLCHCRMCQKASGNIFAALVAARNENVSWTRAGPNVFMSSENVERGFCANCGTPLFYRDATGEHTNFMIGALDDADAFPPATNTCTENMVSWFETVSSLNNDGPTESNGAEWAAAISASNNQHPDQNTQNWSPRPREK